MKLVLLYSLLLVSCITAPKNDLSAKVNLNSAGDTESLKKSLTMSYGSMWGSYMLNTMLITDPYVEALETETGKRNLDDDQKIQVGIKASKNSFTNNKTCFYIDIDSNNIDVAQFKNWVAKVKDSKELHEVVFSNVTGAQSVPKLEYIGEPRFKQNTFGCTSKKVDITKPFTLILIPQIRLMGQDQPIKLTWEPI